MWLGEELIITPYKGLRKAVVVGKADGQKYLLRDPKPVAQKSILMVSVGTIFMKWIWCIPVPWHIGWNAM